MKRIIIFLFIVAVNFANAQVVCDLTYERTLAGFDVYIHNPSGATMYRAKMYIDSDGSPRSYGPSNTGLDWTANAGYPGNWWALVTDAAGDPIIQTASDPYPGMYVSTTSLVDSHYGTTNPLRYVNSETVPFIAMPTNVLASGGIHVGDVGYVYNTTTGQSCFAIYADAGNTTSIGEGSIYLASQIGVDPDVRYGGTSLGIIDYVVFPNSGFGQGTIPSIAQIDSIGNLFLNASNVGGACIVSCIGPVFGSTPPTTAISTPALWDTTNFNSTYTDLDGSCGGGIADRFYQVTDLNPTNEWRSNNANGFFNDDFNTAAIHTDWTTSSGTWNINASTYLQETDESSTNTNIYASLDQDLSDVYLYSWTGTLGGAGTNRRAGFHFFVDQPDSTNRGNSYFVWFRLDDDKIQTYKVISNSWGAGPVDDVPYNFTANQPYDFKVLYNRISGLIRVYINNVQSAEWTDTSPIANGSYISFRNANCNYHVDNFKVFRSRAASANISVGSGPSYDLRYQNQNPASPAGKISSIVSDVSGKLSSIVTQNHNIDFSHPSPVSSIMDGTGTDIDTTYNGSQLQVHWGIASDVNSGIASYYFAIGTTPGGTDIANWINNGPATSVTFTGLSLVHLQTYYTSVIAKDNAGMFSSAFVSDGQLFFNLSSEINSQTNVATPEINVYPNPNNGQFTINLENLKGEFNIVVLDILGKEILKKASIDPKIEIDLSQQKSGLYYVVVNNNGKRYRKKVMKM